MPTDHGPGDPVIAGTLRLLLERLIRAGGAISPSLETGYTVPFDPEIFTLVALEVLDEAGVRFLLHSFASDVVGGREVKGVAFESKPGPIVVEARAVVDCTGDGDLAARAGAAYEVGRDPDGLVQPMTLMFRMVEFERSAFESYVKEHPDQWRGVQGLWDLIKQATMAGELNLPREDILFFGTLHNREVSINSTRVTRVLGIDVWDLTYAEWESRRQMRQISAFLRRSPSPSCCCCSWYKGAAPLGSVLSLGLSCSFGWWSWRHLASAGSCVIRLSWRPSTPFTRWSSFL